MTRMLLTAVAAVLVAGAATLLFWPQAGAQINADGCTCSRPTVVGAARDALTVVYCVCPGTQCVITATAAGQAVPPNVVQSCR